MKKLLCLTVTIVLFAFIQTGALAQSKQNWEEMRGFNFTYKIPKGYSMTESTVTSDGATRGFSYSDYDLEMYEYTYYMPKEQDPEFMENIIQAAAVMSFEKPENEKTVVYQKNGMWFGFGYGKIGEYNAANLIVTAGRDMLLLIFGGKEEIEETFLNEIAETVVHSHVMEMDEWIQTIESENNIEFDYRAIARNPEKYKGKKTNISGEVLQVIGSRNEGYTLRVAIGGDYDEVVLLYISPEVMPDYNILLDDALDAEVTVGGDTTYKTVLGDERTIVLLYANEVAVAF